MGATVTLRKGAARRTLPLEAFFIAYGKQDREPGEFVEQIFVPRPAAGTLNAAYKITKRRDEDISAVAVRPAGDGRGRRSCGRRGSPSAAWRRRRSGRRRPRRRWSASRGRRRRSPRRRAALAEDFAPITDWRASAEYRAVAARNLLQAVLPRERRRAGAAGAGGGVMEATLEAEAAIRGGVHTAQRHDSRAQARHRGGRVHRRHRRAGRARCTPISGSRTGRMPRSCRSISTRCGRRRASSAC